jgi:hypothetical protein
MSANKVKHIDEQSVDRFSVAMKYKLDACRARGKDGWYDPKRCHVNALYSELRRQFNLVEYEDEPDMVDIANLAMMIYIREQDREREENGME